jgi:peptidoglycan/xylan/chitin deacetylase (PgdA/CDA1 family)
MLSIYNYHYIRESFKQKYPSIFGVTPNEFDKQLKTLKNNGDFISPLEVENNLDQVLSSQQNHILITFDDGLKEQYNYALPILKKHNAHAIFFVNTINHTNKTTSNVHKIHLLRSIISNQEILGLLKKCYDTPISNENIEKAKQFYIYDEPESAIIKYQLNIEMDYKSQTHFLNKVFNNYFNEKEISEELYFSRSQIVELSRHGYIGSHTHSHLPLGQLNEDAIIFELNESKTHLEAICERPINQIAYPYGNKAALNDRISSLAKSMSYKVGYTTIPEINTTNQDPLMLNRFDCNEIKI